MISSPIPRHFAGSLYVESVAISIIGTLKLTSVFFRVYKKSAGSLVDGAHLKMCYLYLYILASGLLYTSLGSCVAFSCMFNTYM